jgi:hypothetical protein
VICSIATADFSAKDERYNQEAIGGELHLRPVLNKNQRRRSSLRNIASRSSPFYKKTEVPENMAMGIVMEFSPFMIGDVNS